MKKLIILLFGAAMLLSFVTGLKYTAEGNIEAAVKCFAVATLLFAAPVYSKDLNLSTLGFMNKAYFNSDQQPYTRAELALIEFLNNGAKGQTTLDLSQGRLKVETYMRAFRFTIPAAYSGRRELLNAASQFVQGAIPEEFNLGQLPDGYNIAVSHIRVGFVADAAVVLPQAGVAFGSQPNSWPAALRNSQFIFSQAGAIKCFVDAVGTGTMAPGFGSIGENDGLELQTPFILEENKATKIELYSASGQAFGSPTGGNQLEIILYGAMIRQRQ